MFVTVNETGRIGARVRIEHGGRDLRDYLNSLEKGTPVAVEASGGWYWFMDELEKAGLDARLVNPLEAKHRMGGKNNCDPERFDGRSTEGMGEGRACRAGEFRLRPRGHCTEAACPTYVLKGEIDWRLRRHKVRKTKS